MISTSRVERIAGLALLSLLAVGSLVVLRPFMSALLWAVILTFSTWPIYAWLLRALGGPVGDPSEHPLRLGYVEHDQRGRRVAGPPLAAVRDRVRAQLRETRPDHLRPLNPTPYKVSVSERLYLETQEMLRAAPHPDVLR